MGPPEEPGITMRMIEDVFAAKATYGRDREAADPGAANRKISFQAAFYEIYNGQCGSDPTDCGCRGHQRPDRATES